MNINWGIRLHLLKSICNNTVTLIFGKYLGIEFYLFVSQGGMNDRGFTCKFRNTRSACRNLHVDPLSFMGPCKVWNERETKRNETKQIETKRNKSKRNETNRNETKQNETKQIETKRNKWYDKPLWTNIDIF